MDRYDWVYVSHNYDVRPLSLCGRPSAGQLIAPADPPAKVREEFSVSFAQQSLLGTLETFAAVLEKAG
jgi:hypothetical protein